MWSLSGRLSFAACGLVLTQITALPATGIYSKNLSRTGALAADGKITKVSEREKRQQVMAHIGTIPLAFEANAGRTDPAVKFLSRGLGYTLYLTPQGALFRLYRDAQSTRSGSPGLRARAPRLQAAVVSTSFRRSLAPTSVVGLGRMPGATRTFSGHAAGRPGAPIPMYSSIRYSRVYPGIDVVYYGNQRRLEYDFNVAPGADPDQIELGVEGAKALSIDRAGDLILRTDSGDVVWDRPVSYQRLRDGRRRPVASKYVLASRDSVKIAIGDYDRSRPLTIDPILLYSTYLGGGGWEAGTAIATDPAGNAYVAGYTASVDFPRVNVSAGAREGASLFASANSAGSWSPVQGGLALSEVDLLLTLPSSPSTVFAGGDAGLFKSVDNGASWTNLTGNLPAHPFIRSLAIDPTNTSVMYVGGGIGVFKTTNGGATWQATNSGLPSGYFGFDYPAVASVVVDPLNPAILYATSQGVVYRTTNGGGSWSPAGDIGVYTLIINPATPSTLFARGSNGIYKTTDSANTWSLVGPPDSFLNNILAMDPTNPALLYAPGAISGQSVLFRTTNSGAAWSQIAVGDYFRSALVVSKSNPLVLYSGNEYAGTDTRVFRSDDGGFSWPVGTYLRPAKPRVSALAVNTQSSANVYGGTVLDTDCFVAKFSPTGALIYSTTFGGRNDDYARGISVDSSGNAYVTGNTESTDFPATAGAYQSQFGGPPHNSRDDYLGDGFLVKLNATGEIGYATYLGGNDDDQTSAIAVDKSGNAYVAGRTYSSNFPATLGVGDVFVAKINATGSGLLYCARMRAGAGEVFAHTAVALDSTNNIYVCGETTGILPTTSTAFQRTYGGGYMDGFLAKLSADGAAWLYVSYLGGAGTDVATGVAVNGSGVAYVTGWTSSTNFPTTAGAFQRTLAGYDAAFVSKVNAAGSALGWSTYLGGPAGSQHLGLGIALDSSGDPCVCGWSYGDFPTTPDALMRTAVSGWDMGFFARLNVTGAGLLYATLLGGSGYDSCSGIATDKFGNAFLTGTAYFGTWFPTPGAYQAQVIGNNNYSGDAVYMKFNVVPPVLKTLAISPTTIVGSKTGTGTVTLSLAAQVQTVITLSSSNSAVASVPPTVTIPAGSSSAKFTVTTVAVAASNPVTISAKLGTVTLSKAITVRPISVKSFTLIPNPATGGENVVGVITLEAAAGPDAITATITSGDSTVVKPAQQTITIPKGKTSAPFNLDTLPVTAAVSVPITVTVNTNSPSKSLSVTP